MADFVTSPLYPSSDAVGWICQVKHSTDILFWAPNTLLLLRRYDFGGTIMPSLRTWMTEERGVDFDRSSLGQVRAVCSLATLCRLAQTGL